MSSVIVKNPEILGGTPCFKGTRVPLTCLTNYLEGGQTLADFLEDYPTVSREQALAAIREMNQLLSRDASTVAA